MKRDPLIYLEEALESARDIEEYTKGLSKTEFLRNRQVQDAVCRRFEIIGEAVAQLPHDFVEQHSQISWDKMSGMRNVLIHEYFRVDLDRVWNTIEKSIPQLKAQLEALMEELES